MLTVNSGRLGPETTTNPGLAGTLANNMTMATIKLRSLTSAFENNCLIPRLPLLEQPSLAFKVRRLYLQFYPRSKRVIRKITSIPIQVATPTNGESCSRASGSRSEAPM